MNCNPIQDSASPAGTGDEENFGNDHFGDEELPVKTPPDGTKPAGTVPPTGVKPVPKKRPDAGFGDQN